MNAEILVRLTTDEERRFKAVADHYGGLSVQDVIRMLVKREDDRLSKDR